MWCLNSIAECTTTQLLLVGGTLFAAIYYVITLNLDYFVKRGVPHEKPAPLFGNMFRIVFHFETYRDFVQRLYRAHPKNRFFGFFEFLNPVYYIRDVELIKQIGIKDFDHFMNHRGNFDEELEPIFSRNLFVAKDAKWRHLRTTLSPAFTGSKMRHMFELVVECAQTSIKVLNSNSDDVPMELEMKDFFRRFANDVIASSAFGIKINSLVERDNEFYRRGYEVTKLTGLRAIKQLGFSVFPKLIKFFKITFVDAETTKFFRDIISTTIKYREKNNIVRPDMINLLMQAKKDGEIKAEHDSKLDNVGFSTVEESKASPVAGNAKALKWEDDDVTAQCLIFFVAGFDTSSQLMSFMIYELSLHPEIQERMQQEIDETRESLDGKPITYEALQNMKYLDMVVSESLRMWPPALAIDRYCNKPYVMEDYDGRKVQLNVGDGVWFPIHALHFDPEYYPDPEKFDPERFSDQNKDSINPLSYLPFGIGPRNCIGSRFALMEAKAILFYIFASFTVERSAKTRVPIQVVNDGFNNMVAKDGIWMKFKPRI